MAKISDMHIDKCQTEAESGDYTLDEIYGVWHQMEKAEEAVEGVIQERDMLADENRLMAEYLLYLNHTNRIDLMKDGLDWIITQEQEND